MSFKKKSAKVFDSVDSVRLDSNLQVTPECTATCKGIALIVSNNYEGTKHHLPGTDRDSDYMTTFFSALGNYEVVVPKKNLRVKEFTAICEQLASLEYPEVYKRMLVYFAGHGGDGYITLQDKSVRIEEIQAIFDPSKHQKLYAMARIFFIDACRGSTRYVSEDQTRGGPDKKSYEVYCKYKNELIAYSTLKGHAAYDGESWTQALYKCLVLTQYQQDDLLHVLTHANNKLGSHQTATCKNTLKELVYFWKESGFLIDKAVEDFDINEEANKTAVIDIASAQPSSETEQLLLEEQPDGSGGGGGKSDASMQQCTEQTGTSPAQIALPSAIILPVQEQEQGDTTEEPSASQSEDQVVGSTEAKQSVSQPEDQVITTTGAVVQSVTPTEAVQSDGPTQLAMQAASTVATNQEQRSKAFIVYQNEGDLCDEVHNFVDFLRFRCSVDCDVASYHLNKDITNWDNHIEECITHAEYILLVCTKQLDERLNGQHHNRVEMTRSSGPHILSTTLNSLLVTSKTLPIILDENSKMYIPTSYKATTIYTIFLGSLPIAANTTEQDTKRILDMPEYQDLRSLVTKLLGQKEVVKPPVAPKPPDLTRRWW